METILEELKKAYPSKKVIRAELAKIAEELTAAKKTNIENIDEFDLNVSWAMIITNSSSHFPWKEPMEKDHHLNDGNALGFAKSIVANFNSTLRPGELPRELVSVVKTTTLNKEQEFEV